MSLSVIYRNEQWPRDSSTAHGTLEDPRMKAKTYRRVVTMNVNDRSVVQSDERIQAYEFKSVPNYEHTLVWVNPTTPDLREEQRFDRYPDSVVPGPGGTSLHFVTFPPGSVFADPSFDGEAARSEALVRLRGLADHFEKEDPARHKTNTVDYAVVYDGEIWLELDRRARQPVGNFHHRQKLRSHNLGKKIHYGTGPRGPSTLALLLTQAVKRVFEPLFSCCQFDHQIRFLKFLRSHCGSPGGMDRRLRGGPARL